MSFTIQIALCIVLASALIVSVITDIKLRRILNLVTLPSLGVAMVLHLFDGGAAGLIFGIKGLGLGFICFIIPYSMGVIGAGDVKLMSFVGAVVGVKHTLLALFFIAMAGGFWALILLLRRGTLRQSLTRIWMHMFCLVTMRDTSVLKYSKDELSQEGMPFAIAIAAGVFFYIIYVWRTTGMLPVLGPG